MHSLTTEELKALRRKQDPLLVNVLDEEHFELARIPGSVNIPVSQDNFVAAVVGKASTRDAVVVYCAGPECDASIRAAEMLNDQSFKNVYHFGGGMKEWVAAGNPIERGTPAPAA